MSEEGPSNGKRHLDPRYLAVCESADDIPWFDLKSLRTGDVVEIDTKHHKYMMRVVDSDKRKVLLRSDTDDALKDELEYCLYGTTLTGTGSMLRVGLLAYGQHPLLGRGCIFDGEDFTPPVEKVLPAIGELRVNGQKVLPVETLKDVSVAN